MRTALRNSRRQCRAERGVLISARRQERGDMRLPRSLVQPTVTGCRTPSSRPIYQIATQRQTSRLQARACGGSISTTQNVNDFFKASSDPAIRHRSRDRRAAEIARWTGRQTPDLFRLADAVIGAGAEPCQPQAEGVRGAVAQRGEKPGQTELNAFWQLKTSATSSWADNLGLLGGLSHSSSNPPRCCRLLDGR